ncbi:MAG: DNA translocase FtsK 4TM domain-containing protein [Bacteroidia bacterium]|nr:DNA translocase FtsK 4TM domain-containing protein [Bacteroidia bacterium]
MSVNSKKNINDFEDEFAEKKTGKSKNNKSEKNGTNFTEVKNFIFLKDESARKIVGLLLLCFALFSLASLISFFIYWKSDLSILQGSSESMFDTKNDFEIRNWMGLLGAKFAYKFMFTGFGILSFVIPVYALHYGIYLLVNKKLIKPLIWLKNITIAGIWVLLLAGTFHNYINPNFGGQIGLWLFQEIKDIIALPGLIIFIVLYTYLAVWAIFGYEPIGLNKLFTKETPDTKNDTLTDDSEIYENQVYSGDTLFEKDKIEIDKSDENTFDFSISIKDGKDEKKSITNDELALEIEETEDEEIQEDFEEPILIIKEPIIQHNDINTPYDPKLDLRDFQMPDIEFLNDYGNDTNKEVSIEELEKSKNMIVETLKNYNIGISSIKATTGPTVTLFEIIPSAGIKISRIKNLEDDIALSLAALGIRIIAPIPGKGTIGIEVPNKNPKIVSMKTMLLSQKFQKTDMDLPVCLGKTISNEVYVTDLTKMPHLLMAGATGQGKSVGLNALLISLLYKKHPSELKFVLVDPKKVELTLFKTIERHYLAKLPGDQEAIITDNRQVITTLKSLCLEMDNRYELLQQAMVRNIKEYNAKFINRKLNPNEGHRFLPYIVLIIDEVADLIMTAGKEVEHPIGRLAQLARAIGIHLVLATQRPSVNIVTGTIKANFPARIAFRVTSKIDSRTILDANGADQLVGRGDMLFSNGNDILRLQCPFVDTPEVEKITSFIGAQRAYPNAYILPKVEDEEGETDIDDMAPDDWDSMFEDAARLIVNNQQGSTSLLQRKLKIGYNRAGRLIDQLEIANIVGSFKGSQAREVLIKDEQSLEHVLQEILKK